jgi:hypothetical protein
MINVTFDWKTRVDAQECIYKGFELQARPARDPGKFISSVARENENGVLIELWTRWRLTSLEDAKYLAEAQVLRMTEGVQLKLPLEPSEKAREDSYVRGFAGGFISCIIGVILGTSAVLYTGRGWVFGPVLGSVMVGALFGTLWLLSKGRKLTERAKALKGASR